MVPWFVGAYQVEMGQKCPISYINTNANKL